MVHVSTKSDVSVTLNRIHTALESTGPEGATRCRDAITPLPHNISSKLQPDSASAYLPLFELGIIFFQRVMR
jgi:hypothetical protein